jgi:hypothetical protein
MANGKKRGASKEQRLLKAKKLLETPEGVIRVKACASFKMLRQLFPKLTKVQFHEFRIAGLPYHQAAIAKEQDKQSKKVKGLMALTGKTAEEVKLFLGLTPAPAPAPAPAPVLDESK